MDDTREHQDSNDSSAATLKHPPSRGLRAGTKSKGRPKPVDTLPLWSVLLHNDDVNDMHHVVDSICTVTPLTMERAARVMLDAHNEGLALVCQTHREVAELYRERFQSRGLTCTIEPAR
ncbi:MAG: ATP-dependent Clp protease adaptor ClpS [Phycisphaerales bacterium JB040]